MHPQNQLIDLLQRPDRWAQMHPEVDLGNVVEPIGAPPRSPLGLVYLPELLQTLLLLTPLLTLFYPLSVTQSLIMDGTLPQGGVSLVV